MDSFDSQVLQPTVTVIMTARNAAPFLAISLGSIKAQTRRANQIVFVDDGSSDDTWACAQALLAGVEGAVLIRLPPTGRGAALNIATERASGTWIANVDADDWVAPHFLERVSAILPRDGRWAAVGVGTFVFGHEGHLAGLPVATAEDIRITDVTPLAAHRSPIGHSGTLIARHALSVVGGYDEHRKAHFDYDLWVRLIAAGYRIGKISVPLSGHREHEQQSFEARDRLAYVCQAYIVRRRAIKALNGPFYLEILALLRIMWGLLPRPIRRAISKRGIERFA